MKTAHPITVLCAVVAISFGAAAQTPPTHHHSFGDTKRWARVFDDPKRDEWQKPHEVLIALALPPDAVVADIGAGTGYFSARIARMLPQGRVFASDLEQSMVRYLADRAARESLPNLIPVQASVESPGLPAKVDVALLVDTYHHIEGRERYFRGLKALLKPGGRVAVVDFRPESPVGPPRSARIAPDKVMTEMSAAGYALTERHEFLPHQYYLVFRPTAAQ